MTEYLRKHLQLLTYMTQNSYRTETVKVPMLVGLFIIKIASLI